MNRRTSRSHFGQISSCSPMNQPAGLPTARTLWPPRSGHASAWCEAADCGLSAALQSTRGNGSVDRDAQDMQDHQMDFLNVGAVIARNGDDVIDVKILESVLPA